MFKYVVPFIALGAAAFFFGAKKLKKLDTAVTRLVYKSLSITTLRFELDLAVTNPSKVPCTIQEIDLALVYRDDTMAEMRKRNIGLKVPAEKTIKITNIQADVSMLSAISQLLSYFLGDVDKVVKVVGTLKADGFTYPISEEINLS